MKIVGALLIVLLINLGCNEGRDVNDTIYVERSYQFDYYDSTKIQVADFIEEYMNIMYDSSLQVTNNYWDSEFLMYSQDRFLRNGWKKDTLVKYPPQIISVRTISESEFDVKLLFRYKGSPNKLINLKVLKDPLGRFYFKDLFSENLKQFQSFNSGQHIFYYHPQMIRDTVAEKKVHLFNQEIANLFNRPPIRLRAIVVNNSKQYCELFGYDYSSEMTADIDAGGFAMTFEDAYLSYSGEIFYPHEIVHLYTESLTAHSWFEEGIATYFGGSMGCSLEEHLRVLAIEVDQLDFSTIPTYHYYSQWTNIKYAIGGLFVKLALEEYGGRKSLDVLLNSGKTEADFFKAIHTVFEIDKAGIEAFIKDKLKAYNNSKLQ